MAENLRVTIELGAKDNASQVLNLAFDKIAGKAASTASRISKGAFDVSKKAAIIGGLIAAPLAYGAKQAIAFEDAMGDVSKVAGKGYEVGSKGLAKLATSAKEAATVLGIGADNSAQLMESLASGGIAQKDLAGMTVTAGKIGIAFKMAASDAGDAFVKMRNALGATNQSALSTADAINKIADRGASTPAQILTYMSEGGASVARALGISGAKVATFGSQLIGMGKSGEEAATIMRRLQIALYLPKNADMLETYKKAGRGAEGVMAVLKKGSGIKNVDEQAKYFQRMGQYGSSISLLAKSYGSLKENMDFVSKKSNYDGSVEKGFINRQKTVQGQLNKLKAEAGVLAIDLGTVLLPVIRDLVKDVTPLIKQLGAWISHNPKLTSQLVKGAAAASVLSFAVSGISAAVGGAAKAVEVFNTLKIGARVTSGLAGLRNTAFEGTFKLYERFPKLGEAVYKFSGRLGNLGSVGAKVLPFLATSAQAVGVAIAGITWPVALAIAAVVALGIVIYRNWDKVKPVLINTWRTIKNVAVGAWDTIAFYVGKVWDSITSRFTWLKTAVNWVKSAFASIKAPGWLTNAWGAISRGVANAANNTAGWANDAAARRGIDRGQLGAVDGKLGDIPRRSGFTAPSPAYRAEGANMLGLSNRPGLPAPTGAGRGGNTTVDARLTLNLPPGTSATDAKHFEKMLDKHADRISKIVKEKDRRTKAATL